MNQNKLKSSYKTFTKIAQQLLTDQNKTLSKLEEGFAKARENKGKLTDVWEKMQLLFSLAKDYANGTYNNVSRASIVAIIGSLLYFISPLDVIPDFILGLGFIDDAFIIGYVFNKVAKELEKYQAWRAKQKITISI
jgi:uncharacterized membrane protein YkvA (DUF1232 family)